jgi:histidine triad (HIT) family protein
MPVDTETKDCEFCKIARGEDPSVTVVCEGADWIAFFPHSPATPGHTLVIPRVHAVDLWELEQPLSGELMTAVIRVGRAAEMVLKPEGMNLISSAGKTAEQTVFHLHLHVVPRWSEDWIGQIWPDEPDESAIRNTDLEDLAQRISMACSFAAE